MAKHVCPICEDVYAQPGTVVIRSDVMNQEHEAWYCPECAYAFIAVSDAQKVAALAWETAPQGRFDFELVKAGDGVTRRRV